LKTRYRDGTTHVIFEPEDFIARLAALVPKPRAHLIRLHAAHPCAVPCGQPAAVQIGSPADLSRSVCAIECAAGSGGTERSGARQREGQGCWEKSGYRSAGSAGHGAAGGDGTAPGTELGGAAETGFHHRHHRVPSLRGDAARDREHRGGRCDPPDPRSPRRRAGANGSHRSGAAGPGAAAGAALDLNRWVTREKPPRQADVAGGFGSGRRSGRRRDAFLDGTGRFGKEEGGSDSADGNGPGIGGQARPVSAVRGRVWQGS